MPWRPPRSPPTCWRICATNPATCFWPGDLSLLDSPLIDRERLLASDQVTDTWLLALAVQHGGRLATLDKRLVTAAVHGGEAARYVIL